MNHLDARARAIVDAARDADNPSQTDRERIRRGVAIQIAAGTVAVSTAAVAGTMSLATKVGLVVATVAVVGGGSVGAHKVWQARKASEAAHTHHAMAARAPRAAAPATMPAPAADEVAATAAPLPPPTPESTEVRPGRTDKNRRRAPSTVSDIEAPTVEDSLNAEVAVLARVREELRLGKPTRALDALAEYDRRFDKGMLAEERSALAAIATCQAQPGPAARAKAEAFIRSAPSSPLLERVRVACARAADTVKP
jgi:hypothetical protein